MTSIRELANIEPWRVRLLPAHFDGNFASRLADGYLEIRYANQLDKSQM
jgi:hypothetical protein